MEKYDIDIRGFVGLLRRQLKLILLTIAVTFAITGVAIYALKPAYTATALVMVDPSRKDLLDPQLQGAGAAADSARIDSEVEILRSDNILLLVIDKLGLVQDSEFGVGLSLKSRVLSYLRLAEPTLPTGEQALNAALNKLRNSISVQRRAATYLISVTARSLSAQRAAEIANALAEAYIADQVSSKISAALASRDILQGQVSQARQAVLVAETSFDDFLSTNISNIARDSGRTDLLQMQASIKSLGERRAELLANASSAEASVESGDFEALAAQLQSEAIAELERQRTTLQQQISSQDEATAVSLREEIARIEDQMKSQASTEIQTIRSAVSANQSSEASIREQLRNAVFESTLSPTTLTELYELQQTSEATRRQYQTLLNRIQELEAQAALQVADSRLVSSALAPSAPSFPNTRLILIGAALVSLCLGVALAFLYENVLGGFTTEPQMEAVLRSRGSSVPKARTKPANDGSFADFMVSAPLSAFSESVRRVRAMIDQAARQQINKGSGRVVMISSTAPSEGKTTLALSLARSYALAGQNTLLIDSDLRKPSVHKQLSLEPSKGLLEFLSTDDGLDLKSICAKDSLTKASVIIGARRSGVPTDQLLSGHAYKSLIEAARRIFDVVVIDTPPISPVIDGAYVAQHADTIVFLVRWASTSQVDAKAALRILEEAKREDANIVTVLNQVDANPNSYRNKYNDYYTEIV